MINKNERITDLFQVSAGIEDEKTKTREIRSLVKTKKELSRAKDAQLNLLVPEGNDNVQLFVFPFCCSLKMPM